MHIPVYQPSLRGNEKKYVNECLDSTWISSRGEFITRFEQAFAEYTGVRYAASVCNGTVANHLALLALGLEPGDEVIVPTLTYFASANAIAYVGATPVFVDSQPDTWQMDPDDVRRKLTPRTKAILVVHVYGHPADMDALLAIAQEHNLYVVEDCAEAFGARWAGRHVGGFGHIAAFSFFGSKTVTTGEGGMVVTNDLELHRRVAHLRNQGQAEERRYWHDVIGYNYRMTNICAAIGLAQMERADELMERKLALARRYDALLAGLPVERHRSGSPHALHAYWMYSVLVPDATGRGERLRGHQRDTVMQQMAIAGVETRPVFFPLHTLPMYRGLGREDAFPVATDLSARGINLPSWPDLSDAEMEYVAATLDNALDYALAAESVEAAETGATRTSAAQAAPQTALGG
jgi:perosamine synthetase